MTITEFIPGTRRLYDAGGNILRGEENLKKHGSIVLVPQPTTSPNDPLNWGLLRKIWHSALVCYIVGFTAATSNDAGSASSGINTDYGIDYAYFNTGAGVLFLGIGYWALLSSPATHLYGRRILYLIGMILNIIGSFWFAKTTNYNDVIWSQLFIGAGESVAEFVAQMSLLDIWFEHQNGSVLGLYTLAMAVGTYLGPLVAGHIADSSLGYTWIGWFGAIISGFTLVLFYFGFEETAFRRDRQLINGSDQYLIEGVEVLKREAVPVSNTDDTKEKMVSQDLSQDEQYRSPVTYGNAKTYTDRIRYITPAANLRGLGFKQFFVRLVHTFRVFTFPAVWYAGLQWGLQSSTLTFYLTIEQTTWYADPYNYSNAQVGNMNIPCIIGAIVGCFYGGYLSDRFVIWATKRNKGVMESEYRLYLNLVCIAIFPTGLLLFGIGSDRGWNWPVPYIGLGFIGFGYGCAGDLSITYLADSYPDMIIEGMVGVAVINNSTACIFSFVASIWLGKSGITSTFIGMTVISFVILGLTVPMILCGKAARRETKGRYLRFLQIRNGFDR